MIDIQQCRTQLLNIENQMKNIPNPPQNQYQSNAMQQLQQQHAYWSNLMNQAMVEMNARQYQQQVMPNNGYYPQQPMPYQPNGVYYPQQQQYARPTPSIGSPFNNMYNTAPSARTNVCSPGRYSSENSNIPQQPYTPSYPKPMEPTTIAPTKMRAVGNEYDLILANGLDVEETDNGTGKYELVVVGNITAHDMFHGSVANQEPIKVKNVKDVFELKDVNLFKDNVVLLNVEEPYYFNIKSTLHKEFSNKLNGKLQAIEPCDILPIIVEYADNIPGLTRWIDKQYTPMLNGMLKNMANSQIAVDSLPEDILDLSKVVNETRQVKVREILSSIVLGLARAFKRMHIDLLTTSTYNHVGNELEEAEKKVSNLTTVKVTYTVPTVLITDSEVCKTVIEQLKDGKPRYLRDDSFKELYRILNDAIDKLNTDKHVTHSAPIRLTLLDATNVEHNYLVYKNQYNQLVVA